MKHLILATMLMLLVGGCSVKNVYSTYYTGLSGAEIQARDDLITCERAEIINLPPAKSLDSFVQDMFADGYWNVGYSAWNGSMGQPPAEALAHAKILGACVVANASKYTHSTLSGNMYGFGTTDRRDYYGVFFVKNKPGILSIALADPSNEYKRDMDTGAGALVTGVRRGGNGEKANIFVDDIIMSINGEPLYMDTQYNLLFKFGEMNKITIYRNGKIITKSIFIP